jgi:hypothetical protein
VVDGPVKELLRGVAQNCWNGALHDCVAADDALTQPLQSTSHLKQEMGTYFSETDTLIVFRRLTSFSKTPFLSWTMIQPIRQPGTKNLRHKLT